jgi:flagellar protein FliO/FliZ
MKLSLPFKTAAAAACSLLACAPSALAASGERTPLDLGHVTTAHSAGSSSSGSLVRTFVGLAIVLAVIYGLYWVLKQVKSSRAEKASGTGLAAVSTLPLGTGRSLQVVRAGSDFVLLGVSEQGVTPIRSYSEREAYDAGLLDDDFAAAADEPVARRGGLLEELRRRTVRR